MDEPGFLPRSHIAIAGLGLMGGSLAMALRGKCAALLGVDPDPQTVALAKELDLVEHLSTSPAEIFPQADLIILAAPVCAILEILKWLPDLHPGAPLVIDLGSTKRQIVVAMEALPQRFDPLGGHPMCGKEMATLAYAEAGLYRGAPFAFTPLKRTSSRARLLAEELALAVGAIPLWIDAETHDRWVGATSHLPYLVANALAAVTPQEAATLVGPGFRSTARLAGASIPMMLDILETNRSNILAALGEFRHTLDGLVASLEAGDLERLRQQLAQGADRYQALLKA
jgi:prephenate dehydrogenase